MINQNNTNNKKPMPEVLVRIFKSMAREYGADWGKNPCLVKLVVTHLMNEIGYIPGEEYNL